MGIPAGKWIRVSTDQQDAENQVPDLNAYGSASGYDWEATYKVDGKSAFHGKHQAWIDQALADTRAGKIKVLVVWASDRIERRGVEATLKLRRQFVEAGGRIEFVKEPFLNGTDASVELLGAVTGWVAHQESVRKSERQAMVRQTIKANGGYIGRWSWGYVSAGTKYARTLIPTDAGRKYVPEIFARVIVGMSLAAVCAWLDAEGIKAPGKGTWWPKTLSKLVRNPIYIGRPQDRDGNTVQRCEALVTAETFRLAGEAMDARYQERGDLNPDGRALLAETIACPLCQDSPMYRINCPTTRDGQRADMFYYRCAGRGSQRKGCGNMVRLDAVDKLADHFMSQLDEPVMAAIVHPATGDRTAEVDELRAEIKGLDPLADDYVTRVTGLKAELDRVLAEPGSPEWTEYAPTGETYGQQWDAMTSPERGPWLRERGIRVYAVRSDRASLIERAFALRALGAASLLEGDGVSIVVTWLGSGLG